VTIVDVSLSQDNLLRGQLVNRDGASKSKATVILVSTRGPVAQTTTNDKGTFAFRVAKGGVYVLSDGETSTLVRAWTKQAAPPSAQPGILMVSDQGVARAAIGRDPLASTYVLGTAAAAGVIAGFVIWVSNNDDAS
jgi:hypothetical protein